MKIALTKSAVDVYADALESEGAVDAACRLKALSGIFLGLVSRPLGDLLDLIDKVKLQPDQIPDNSPGITVAATLPSLRNLEVILKKTSTPSRLDDLNAFRTRLQRHESASIDQLVKAVQFLRRGRGDGGTVITNDCNALADKLKAALGRDDQFNPLFDQLSTLDAASVASVANALMSSGSSKSRKRDLDRIRERHESHRSLLAKQRAMAGRSAA